jgi:hypothetical protein
MIDSFWKQPATLLESRLEGLCLEGASWSDPRAVLGGSLATIVLNVAEQATGRHRRFSIAIEQGSTVDHDQIFGLYRRHDFPLVCSAV